MSSSRPTDPRVFFREAVARALREEMERDERVMILGEDVGAKGGVFGVTDGLQKQFGEWRVLDSPLAESCIVGVAIGAALNGMRPIAEIQFQDFIMPAVDQIISEAAKMRYRSNGDWGVPMVVRAPFGGGVHGALYHSQSIEAIFCHIPGLRVVVPSSPYDAKGMIIGALRDPDPVLYFEHKRAYRAIKGDVPDDACWRVPIGVAAIARPGNDATVVTYGMHRHLAVEAADRLAAEGVGDVEVLDLRTISPLDVDAILESVRRTSRCLVVHEDNRSFGVGAEVAAVVAEEAFYDLDAPVRRLCTADVPAFPFAPPLEAELSIGADEIGVALRALLDA